MESQKGILSIDLGTTYLAEIDFFFFFFFLESVEKKLKVG